MVDKIVYLRQSYHFGPHKIAMYLKRYHDIAISPSGVWRILKRLDMSRLPSSQRYRRHVDRWKRYEKPLPGHRVQFDVKFIATAHEDLRLSKPTAFRLSHPLVSRRRTVRVALAVTPLTASRRQRIR